MNLRPALMRLGPDLAVMVRSDLATDRQPHAGTTELRLAVQTLEWRKYMVNLIGRNTDPVVGEREMPVVAFCTDAYREARCVAGRSEEHTSELQSLMRISYAVSCLTKTKP